MGRAGGFWGVGARISVAGSGSAWEFVDSGRFAFDVVGVRLGAS